MASDGLAGAIVVWTEGQPAFPRGGAVADVPGHGNARLAVEEATPNPARHSTRIRFDLPGTQRISAVVFDVTETRVRSPIDRQELPAGSNALAWDGLCDDGTLARAGIDFVLISRPDHSVARKVTIFR